MLAFVGCDDDDKKVDTPPAGDEITIAPESETFGSKGGSVEVIVTSSGKWTLAGDYDWVTPSALSGKDGDIVKFTVAANETDQDKTAEYTFTVGTKQAKFTVVSKKMGTVVDKVSITPKSEHFDKNGGSVEVIVTSSDAWTLTGECDWVTPSAAKGEDGAVVKFDVAANTDADPREVTYTFTVGKETAELTLSQDGGISVEVVSEKELTVLEQGGEIEIRLNSEMNYRDLTQSVSAEGEGWLNYAITLAGSGDCTAKMVYNVAANEEYEGRSAVITISAGKAQAEVKISQKAKTLLETDKDTFVVGMEASTIDIPIRSNVEYEIQIEDDAKSWLTHKGKSGETEQFAIAAADVRRSTTILFVSEAKSIEVFVMQKPDAIINFAPYYGTNRAWPAWNDPTPVTDMTAFTLEALVNPTEAKRAGSLSTIMGIEGKFLIRMGDVGYAWNQLQVVWEIGSGWNASEIKLTNNTMILPELNTWYHIAVTYVKGDAVRVYIDGKEVASKVGSLPDKVNFGVEHNDESAPAGGTINRCFWVGYAYDNARDFKGMMSELRIWNRALTVDEINAENHFYTVDPMSDGLVTYWKSNEGKGNVIKDFSSYGNDLSVQKDIDWRVVSVPE